MMGLGETVMLLITSKRLLILLYASLVLLHLKAKHPFIATLVKMIEMMNT
jgi:hypothetical protein